MKKKFKNLKNQIKIAFFPVVLQGVHFLELMCPMLFGIRIKIILSK